MKRKTSLYLLALTLVFSLILSSCGQSQTSAPPAENDERANVSVTDTSTPADGQETPDDLHTTIADPPADALAEETDGSEDKSGEEVSAPNENEPEVNTPAPAETVSEPEQAQEQTTVPEHESEVTQTPATSESAAEPEQGETTESDTTSSGTTLSGTTLTLQFGGGESFTINMYDNDTANKIAEYVGTAAWQLPIYHYDDYDGWESFQYYDIPSRYDIPDGSASVTSQKAGAVYYSHPNRIILFYQDANISTEYTPVGYIDFSQDLVDAVENNPVVQGWGNKLVFIQP